MDKHFYEWDMHKPGDKGFRRLNEDGKEDIRSKPIPTESARIRKLKDIIDGKRKKKV